MTKSHTYARSSHTTEKQRVSMDSAVAGLLLINYIYYCNPAYCCNL